MTGMFYHILYKSTTIKEESFEIVAKIEEAP